MYTSLEHYIDGNWVKPSGSKSQDVMNPSTSKPIGQLGHVSRGDLDKALAAADKGFKQWRRVSPFERGKILRKAADLVRTRADEIAKVLTQEQGKVLMEAKLEVQSSADIIDWYAGEGQRAYGRIIPARADGVRNMVILEPIGPVAGFSPWNFPVTQAVRKIAASLAAGCSIIIKCPEETPGSPIGLVKCFHDAGVPAGVLNLVYGVPAEISEYLIPHPVIRKISFTGSVPVGKHLNALAASHMKRATMELGGHSPVLVFDDADVEGAAKLMGAFKYRNAGQVCVSPTRFFVHDKVYDTFVGKFIDIAKKTKVGDGLEPDTRMGPLANPRRVNAIEGFVTDAQDKGAKVADRRQAHRQPGQLLRANGADRCARQRPHHERGAVRPGRRDAALQGDRRRAGARQQAALRPRQLRLHQGRQDGGQGGGRAEVRHGDDQPLRYRPARDAVRRRQGLGLRPRRRHRGPAGLHAGEVRQPSGLSANRILVRGARTLH